MNLFLDVAIPFCLIILCTAAAFMGIITMTCIVQAIFCGAGYQGFNYDDDDDWEPRTVPGVGSNYVKVIIEYGERQENIQRQRNCTGEPTDTECVLHGAD